MNTPNELHYNFIWTYASLVPFDNFLYLRELHILQRQQIRVAHLTKHTLTSSTSPSPSRSALISPSKNKRELFKILDISITWSTTECKKAYNKLARHYHPDKWKSTKAFLELKRIEILKNMLNAHEEICTLKTSQISHAIK